MIPIIEDGEVVMVIEGGPAGTCADYTLEYHY